MKRLINKVGFFVVAIVISVIGWGYARLVAPSVELHNQLRTMITSGDTTKIKALSYDDDTYKFFMNASKNASITTTDFQGGGKPKAGVIIGLFGATIGNQTLDCVMVSHTDKFHLLPQWKLVKISRKPIGIDPKWVDLG